MLLHELTVTQNTPRNTPTSGNPAAPQPMEDRMEKQFTLRHKGIEVTVNASEVMARMDALISEHGSWVPGETSITECNNAPASVTPRSTFEHQEMNTEAKTRIEAQHAAMAQGGLAPDTTQQFYATGTALADSGVKAQRSRRAEYLDQLPVEDIAAELSQRVADEHRKEVIVKARDLASGLAINGKLTFDGLRLHEQAIKGMLTRVESCATSYVFGLRDRIAEALKSDTPNADAINAEKTELLETLRYELHRQGDVEIMLRTRDGLKDVFAAMSPGYAVADAPSTLPHILAQLPSNARGTYSYDPITTATQFRASVWTPTPAEEQAVGEAFEAYVAYSTRDNGTGSWNGGGGVLLVRCLNATTYIAHDGTTRRRHVGRIVLDIPAIAARATHAINVLCQAWGKARETRLDSTITSDSGRLIPIEEVIPGYYRSMFTARESALVGVIPGRREDHIKALTPLYFSERRDPEAVTKADLANGVTRYIQQFPLPVQHATEQAVASYLVSKATPAYVAR
jgi:hypothetical protein